MEVSNIRIALILASFLFCAAGFAFDARPTVSPTDHGENIAAMKGAFLRCAAGSTPLNGPSPFVEFLEKRDKFLRTYFNKRGQLSAYLRGLAAGEASYRKERRDFGDQRGGTLGMLCLYFKIRMEFEADSSELAQELVRRYFEQHDFDASSRSNPMPSSIPEPLKGDYRKGFMYGILRNAGEYCGIHKNIEGRFPLRTALAAIRKETFEARPSEVYRQGYARAQWAVSDFRMINMLDTFCETYVRTNFSKILMGDLHRVELY